MEKNIILIWLICTHDKNSDYINTSMSLKRSIRKKGSIEKKKLIITQARKCILRVRKFGWHWHSFSLVIFFLCPPPFIFFYNNMNDTAKCSLGSYQKIDFIYPFNTFFANQKLICLRKLYTSHDIGRFLGQSVRIVGPFSLRLQGCSWGLEINTKQSSS